MVVISAASNIGQGVAYGVQGEVGEEDGGGGVEGHIGSSQDILVGPVRIW
jgi:hypothetical protein